MRRRQSRRTAARYYGIIQPRWKRRGRTRLRQRPLEEETQPVHSQPASSAEKAPAGLLQVTGTPRKDEYYDSLGYPRIRPRLGRRSGASPLAGGGNTALYVVQPGDTLTSIADTFQVALNDLITVNPELRGSDTIFPGQILAIPLSEVVLPPEERTLVPYVVQSGQSLANIANMFGINPDDLRRVNPQIGSDDTIFVGQVVWVPTFMDAPASQLPGILYVLQPGDTLGAVGARFDVSRDDIVAANPQLTDPDRVFPGETILVPVSGVPPQPLFYRRRYVVQPGDTIEGIAARFQVTLGALQEANSLLLAVPGLVLLVPEGVPVPDAPSPGPGERSCRTTFGRPLTLGDDDFTFVPFGERFVFPFYGERKTGMFVNANGNVTFGEGDPNFFPSVDAFIEGPPRIAPFWTDLNPAAAVADAGVFVDTVIDDDPAQSRIVVTWDRTPYFFTELYNTVQLSLFADGTIQICYFAIAEPPDSRPILIGVARGQGEPESNIIRYNGTDNPRRTGDLAEPTPQGSLSGRILTYRFVPEQGNYRLEFVRSS